jgi:predicted NUDIX family NTP pyrophosphohydrolase
MVCHRPQRITGRADQQYGSPVAKPQSAGALLYRRRGDALEVLIVHPSGAYNRRAPWSIPKGLPEPGETLADAARRETLEETGVDIIGELIELGHIDYTRSRKRIHCFAATLPEDAEPRCASWEIDRAEILPVDEARERLHPDQAPFIDRLLAALK